MFGAVSMGAALAVGYGFDDGGEETGFPAVMTYLAGALFVVSFLSLSIALSLTLFLTLANRVPPLRTFFDQPLPWVMLILLYACWLLVPAFVWIGGWSDGGGLDGPCLSGQWVRDVMPGSKSVSTRYESWPPFSTRCVVDGPNGHAEKLFPPAGTWITVFVLALAPLALWPLARRVVGQQSQQQA